MTEPVSSPDKLIGTDADRFLISDLCDLVASYMDEEQVK